MKINLKALIYSFLLICFCSAANAQINVPDSVRVSIGAVIASAAGTDFGTGVNTPSSGTAASAYKLGAGFSLNAEVPVMSHIYVIASAGYTSFFTTGDAIYSQQAITNVPLPNFNTVPLKLGLKFLIGNRFYIQGQAGETLLANKAELYAAYGSAFSWSPQIGLVLPLKKRHTYIDGGISYENMATFYNNTSHSTFWALHVAYAFNL